MTGRQQYPEGMPRPVSIGLARGTHKRIKELARVLTWEIGRPVTMSEAIDIAIDRSGLIKEPQP